MQGCSVARRGEEQAQENQPQLTRTDPLETANRVGPRVRHHSLHPHIGREIVGIGLPQPQVISGWLRQAHRPVLQSAAGRALRQVAVATVVEAAEEPVQQQDLQQDSVRDRQRGYIRVNVGNFETINKLISKIDKSLGSIVDVGE